MARRDEYDKAQAARRLKVPVTTWRWARHPRLIPKPDVSGMAVVAGGGGDAGRRGCARLGATGVGQPVGDGQPAG